MHVRNPIGIRILVPLMLAACSGAGEYAGRSSAAVRQDAVPERVKTLLRDALPASGHAGPQIEGGASRALPGATWYRATYWTGFHGPRLNAALLVVARDTFVVVAPSDIEALAGVLPDRCSLAAENRLEFWTRFLDEAALLPAARIVRSAQDFSAGDRLFLRPAQALDRVEPPRHGVSGPRATLTWYAASSHGVTNVRVTSDERCTPTVSFEHVALRDVHS